MLKRTLALLAIAAAISLAASGCSAFQSASESALSGQAIASNGMKPVAHVNGEICGYYLFNLVPVVTGDPKNEDSFLMWDDSVTLENTVSMITAKAKDMGGRAVLDLDSKTNSSGAFTFWILWNREVQVSGNVVK